jgi:2-(1,2-epoxy-1,2-dihydrophenyl)acetyl-CoA isomerase
MRQEELIDQRVVASWDDGVFRICLSRPEAGNAIDLRMARALLTAAQRAVDLARAGDLRVIVLEARGAAFCAGGDLRYLGGAPSDALASMVDAMHRAVVAMSEVPAPVISVLDGPVAGGGIGLALAGDVIIASERTSFYSAYTAIGLAPDCGTSWQLARRVGPTRAMDLLLTNRRLEAPEALAWGLVSRVVPQAALARESAEVIADLAARSVDALSRTRALVRGALSSTLDAHLDREAWALTRAVADGDGRQGIQSFAR